MSENVPRARDEGRLPRPLPLPEEELENPRPVTVLKLIYNALVRVFHDPVGMIIGSAFLTLMLWGPHGNLELVGKLWGGWLDKAPGRPSIIPCLPWDREWIGFAAGFIFVVLIPIVLIKWVYHQNPRDYGLGLPVPGRRRLTVLSGILLFVLSLPAFYLGARDADMQATYPLFRGGFDSIGAFIVYEAGYLLFFIAIEFIFRGYLLFGLFRLRDREAPAGVTGIQGPLVFGYYAILISMLSYTAWHLGKPVPELWGTLVWGIAAGAIALATGTILHIILVHWLLNVVLDLMIWQGWTL